MTAHKLRLKNENNKKRRSLPLYYQIYILLKQQLLENQFPPDLPLPGDEELRERFGVSRVTVRKSFELLEEDGLIIRERGRGTFPTNDRARPVKRANISGLYENLFTISAKGSAKTLFFELVDTPPQILQDIDDFEYLSLKVERVRRHKKDAVYFVRSYIPAHIGKKVRKKDIVKEPILFVLDHFGHIPESAAQTLSAVVATPQLASELDVEIGSPLIYMKRLVRDQNDEVIEFSEYFYRPEKFTYQIALTRRGSSDAPRWVPVDN